MSFYPARVEQRWARGTFGGKIRLGHVIIYERAPALGTNTAILSATTLAEGATTEVAAVDGIITHPDVPRVLLVKGNAASVAGEVVVEGYNANNQAITDTITASGSSAVAGAKAFARVTRITLPARAASGNTISVGTTNVVGLWHTLDDDDFLLKATFNGSTDAGTLAVDADAVEKNLYTAAGPFDGTKTLRLLYVAG